MKGGFIQFPILVIIAILVIGAGVGTAVILRNQAITIPAPEGVTTTEGAETQNGSATTTVLDAVPTTTRATTDYSSEEIEELRREVEALKASQKSSSQAILSTTPQPVSPQPTIAQNSVPSISEIVGHWRFFTVKVESAGGFGSGLVIKSSDNTFKVLTNKHVVEGETSLFIGLPNVSIPFHGGSVTFASEDFATISLGNSDEYLKNLLTGVPYTGFCSENQKPILGDEIVMLGYPSIGSRADLADVTVTRGVISGFERNRYITDAKINPGNSGGVAISIKNNCYFGIPTEKVYQTGVEGKYTGSEPLARILDIWKVMGQF